MGLLAEWKQILIFLGPLYQYERTRGPKCCQAHFL
jgi:hypothetical protein